MVLRERQSDPRRRAARRGVVGALAGALIMLVAASALAVSGRDTGVLGLSGVERGGSSGPVSESSRGAALTSEPGACLTWSRTDASDVSPVDCAAPHVFESVGPVTAPQPAGAPFPGDDAWQKLVTDQCTPLARTYLGGKLDPSGRYRAGALKPTQQAWGGGDRTVRCGLQAPGRTGALFTSTGKVADQDQAVVFDRGTCLGLAGKDVSDPVDCGSTHAAEVAGTVDLGKQFPGGRPSVDDQDNYLQPTCAKVAADHVGGERKLADTKLTPYWTNLSEESWNVGTRRVDCNLGALLGDGSGFAPLTGRAADGVTIGGAAAGATVPPLPPGAPAGRPATGGPAGDGAARGGGDPGRADRSASPAPSSTPALPGLGTPGGGSSGVPSVPLPPLPVPVPGQ